METTKFKGPVFGKRKSINITYLNGAKVMEVGNEHTKINCIAPPENGGDLFDWVSRYSDDIEKQLLTHGGLLFRGWNVLSITKTVLSRCTMKTHTPYRGPM